MNGINESYDHIPEATWEYVEAWDEDEPTSSTQEEEENENQIH